MTQRTPCPEPLERLDVDPRVAVAAWRYPSASEPGRTHDVALSPEGWWSCECWDYLEHDECKHVHDARARWYARRPCTHGLLVSEGTERICVLCGLVYDRWARVLAPLREACRRRWSLSGVVSPWTAGERSEYPS